MRRGKGNLDEFWEIEIKEKDAHGSEIMKKPRYENSVSRGDRNIDKSLYLY